MAGSTKTARGAMVVLLWYRKGLRVHDSPALAAACEGATAVCPVFCLDPWFVSSGKVGPIRLRFLAEALADLDASLRARGSRLLVLHGKPEEELPRVAREWGATHIVWEKDGVEPYGLKRDAAVREACAPLGVTITETNGHARVRGPHACDGSARRAPTPHPPSRPPPYRAIRARLPLRARARHGAVTRSATSTSCSSSPRARR